MAFEPTLTSKAKWEWTFKVGKVVMAKDTVWAETPAEAKRLATRASETGYWRKKWLPDGDGYIKIQGDARRADTNRIVILRKIWEG